jgi:hypothetical protein
MIKTLLYTGVRVSELVRIRLAEVDLDSCRIRIDQGKGKKDRYVPFPTSFKETLALHIDSQRRAGSTHLFESSWKRPYSDRGVRKILARYATAAGIQSPISPHRLRHFLFTWLKTQGIDDALIQPYSGHATRQSLEIYSRIALADAQQAYDGAIGRYPSETFLWHERDRRGRRDARLPLVTRLLPAPRVMRRLETRHCPSRTSHDTFRLPKARWCTARGSWSTSKHDLE